MTSKFAILILSCDKYADLWEPFFYLFWNNWPDCPYPVYLGSNSIAYKEDKRIKTILSGKDTDWSASFKKILVQIPEKHIFVWMEDAPVTSNIETERFAETFNFLKTSGAVHIYHRPNLQPEKWINDGKYGVYEKGMPYRVSAVGFWQKDYLGKILINGENSWNFEIMGSYRSSYTDGFYCLHKKLFEFIHLVEKGRWLPAGIDYCLQNKVPLNISARPKIAAEKRILSLLQAAYFNRVLSVDWKYRVKLMNLLRRLLVSY